jgi:hypothetical protein
MKTKKLLGTFIFLSVLGFLLVGCASFDIEKELSLLFTPQMPMYFTANPVKLPLYLTEPTGYLATSYNQPWWLSNPVYQQKPIDSDFLLKKFMPKQTFPFLDPAFQQKLNDSLPKFSLPENLFKDIPATKVIREQNPFKGSK